jgi:hypothetical protein
MLNSMSADVRVVTAMRFPWRLTISVYRCEELHQAVPSDEKYNIAWRRHESLALTDQYLRLSQSTTVPICTGRTFT